MNYFVNRLSIYQHVDNQILEGAHERTKLPNIRQSTKIFPYYLEVHGAQSFRTNRIC